MIMMMMMKISQNFVSNQSDELDQPLNGMRIVYSFFENSVKSFGFVKKKILKKKFKALTSTSNKRKKNKMSSGGDVKVKSEVNMNRPQPWQKLDDGYSVGFFFFFFEIFFFFSNDLID